MNPKLKTAGLVTAQASFEHPTHTAAQFDVAWVTGLTFRQEKYADQHEALCITPHGKDPKVAGLHLTADAARTLAQSMSVEAVQGPNVEIRNHRDGQPNEWSCFTASDAHVLVACMVEALVGH